MKLKVLFVANTIVSVPFGIGSVLAPHLFLSLFGATLGPAGAVMMQYGGAWLIGLGLLTWFSRNEAESKVGRGIALALLVAYLVALVVSLLGQVAGVLNILGWMPVAIQAFFTAGFGYSLVAGPKGFAAATSKG
jgi:cytosine/uracil/thiamine/allantoin permease